MTPEFQYMMHLAGCAALGKEPEAPPEGIDWEQVLTYANEQTALTLVQYAMKKAPFNIPAEHRGTAIARLNHAAMRALVRKMGVLQVLGELEKQGIPAAVMKGFAIARDYAQPDVRISGDADIYIREEDEERALAIFEGFGFTYKQREAADKDTALHHPKYGVVELHVRLFDDFIDEIWHEGRVQEFIEPYQKQDTPDGAYYTLGDTDHFLFVLEHMMKHFIADGMALRMMLDVGVLLMKRGDRLDQSRIRSFLEQRRYTGAVRVFAEILREYCGFSFDNGWLLSGSEEADRAAMAAVLEDMELGGVRGQKLGDFSIRSDGMRVYNAELQKKQMGSTRYWFASKKGWLPLIFPPLRIMKEKYPVLKKAPFLCPVMWLHRLATKGIRHARDKDVDLTDYQISLEEKYMEANGGTARVDMFRKLGLM